MSTTKAVAASLLILALPLVAVAQSSSPNLSSLLSELAALQQQILSLGGTSSAATTSTPTPTTTAPGSSGQQPGLCPDLSRPLSLGSQGADVAGLQTFLEQEGLFNGIATGYFGNLTEAAVASWQQRNNVVSGGDANSTGLGVVGPKTRAAMEASCLPGASSSTGKRCLPVLPPASECATNWQPVADANGCTTYFQCTITLPTYSTTPTTATSSAPVACPVVPKPTCSGTVMPFQTNANGCITSYQCSI